MKVLKKALKWFVIAIFLLVIGGIVFLKLYLPKVDPASDLKVEITPERVKRGEYLANHVTVCIDCHSTRDFSRFSGPPVEGTFGMGGEIFDQKFGFPGIYYAQNITPEGIDRYTDGELYRVITTGVTKEGKSLFPVMPYKYYGQLDPEDINSIIAYLRTLPPIHHQVSASHSDFPMNFLINTIPENASPGKRPEKSDSVNLGKYLTIAGGCMECHTQVDNQGRLLPGLEYAGGREFILPDGSVVRSANLTSDPETGLGNWTKQVFLDLFHERSDSTILHTQLKKGDFNTIMPWIMYGKMTDEDLSAIFSYLQTLNPVENHVEIIKTL